MSEVDAITNTLSPFLSPQYWDGHTIGHGEIEPFSKPPTDRCSRRLAYSTLKDRLSLMRNKYALEAFQNGMAFNAENFNPGTVIIFREEILIAAASPPALNVEDLQEQELPERPMGLSTQLGRHDHVINFLDFGGIGYSTNVLWGVVSSTKGGEATIETVPAAHVCKSENQVKLLDIPRPRNPRMPIGKTEHTHIRASELVERCNILEVVGYGDAEKRKRRVWGFAGKLARTKA